MALVERTTIETHPKCLTRGRLVKVEYDPDGQFGPQFRWTFKTARKTSEGKNFQLPYWTTPVLNEKSNLYRLLEAFGENPNDDRWLVDSTDDFAPLVDREVQVNVIHKPTQNGVVGKIDTILALPGDEEEERRPVVAAGNGGKKGIWDKDD